MKTYIEPEIDPMQNAANEPDMASDHEYTYSDYLKFQFEEMVELIRGKIYKMSPAPRTSHQIISKNLEYLIESHIRKQKCVMFHAPTDVVLPIANKKRNKATTVVQPDIMVICNPFIIEEKAIFGVPNLVIEILSSGTVPKDRGIKYDVYEEAGVGEYWIVSPEYETVEVFLLENGKYSKKHVLDKNEKVKTYTLPELEIDLKEVFN